jgi:hypothetical protein
VSGLDLPNSTLSGGLAGSDDVMRRGSPDMVCAYHGAYAPQGGGTAGPLDLGIAPPPVPARPRRDNSMASPHASPPTSASVSHASTRRDELAQHRATRSYPHLGTDGPDTPAKLGRGYLDLDGQNVGGVSG